jgi:putative oxidoreductase
MYLLTDIQRKLGILFILMIYMYSSSNKILNFTDTLNGIINKGLPLPYIALLFAITSQLVGIIFILLDEFYKKNDILRYVGKYSLIIFTLLTIYFYHNILVDKTQTTQFLKNMGLIGGLMLI